MFPQGGALWCPGCEMEYWRENEWWRCDESGEPEKVAVTDGGTGREDVEQIVELWWHHTQSLNSGGDS